MWYKRRAFHISPSVHKKKCASKHLSSTHTYCREHSYFTGISRNSSNSTAKDSGKSLRDNKADKAKEVEQVFMRSRSTLLWQFRVGKKKQKRCWWPRVRIWTSLWWRKRQTKNREKHLPRAKKRRKTWWQKNPAKVYFPKKYRGLKQNQKLHGSGTIEASFKTWKIPLLPLHERGSGNHRLSEKKKPKGKKPTNCRFETNIFIHHFLSIFLKVFHLAWKF